MELFQLNYFATAARLGNFSRAAEAVCVSQPSLSLQISNLEKEMGVSLFARRGRSVELTEAGRTLLEYAERLLEMEREARRAVRAVVGLERGRLSLWTLPTLGQHLLPRSLARFRQSYSGIDITVHEAVPARAVCEAVATNRADIGFVHLATPASNAPVAGLCVRPLLTEELVVVVPESHRLASQTEAPSLATLAAEDFVWVPEGSTAEHPIYAVCVAVGFTPRIVCVSGSAQGMQALVAAGLGIALLPRLAIHPPAGVVVVELAPPRPTRTLAAVWREGNGALSHAANAFLEMVVDDVQ